LALPCLLALRKEYSLPLARSYPHDLGYGEVQFRERLRSKTLLSPDSSDILVALRSGLSEDLDASPLQVDEPNLSDPGTGIKRKLHFPVVRGRGLGHLNHEQYVLGPRVGLSVEISARSEQREVGLRFGALAQANRVLRTNDRAITHCPV